MNRKNRAEKDDKVTYFARGHMINLGLVIFLIILLYTMYFVVQYISEDRVSVYEVEQGSIVRDSVYTGIAIRNETVVESTSSGSYIISYYASAGEKAGVSTLVYSLSKNESITELYSDTVSQSEYLSDDVLSDLNRQFLEFTATYSDLNYSDVYSFTASVNNSLTESLNSSALSYLQEADAADDVDLFYASQPGVIAYYTDGYESLSSSDVTVEMIENQSADRVTYSNGDSVSKGDVVYKLTNDENWDVVISVSESMAEELEEMSVVEVEFAKDSRSAWASVTIRRDGDAYLAVLSFTNSMARYSDDRFLTLTLKLDDVDGLKIPNSAITEKTFYVIPSSFITYDDTEDSYTMQILSDNGTAETIYPEIYHAADEEYYVLSDDLSSGMTIVDLDSNTGTVFETAVLKGCYNINKGYAVFKQIEVLYESESYTIVADDTDYGLSQYDYIALNASSVTDGQIIY